MAVYFNAAKVMINSLMATVFFSRCVLYLPIYMAAFMEKQSLSPITYVVDLTGLN